MEPRYEIIGMKRDGKRWKFVARPVPEPNIEFECNDHKIEAIVWAKARDNESTRMVFANDNGKWLLKRIGD